MSATSQHIALDGLHLGVARRPMAGPDLPWTRRRFLGVGAAVVLGGILAGCGSDDSSSSPTTAAGNGGGGFPRTVNHAVGSTVIETRPVRVVAATDGGDLASLLALGITPIGFGQRNDPLTPWIADAGGGDPAIERYELASDTNFEVLASWRPDVIIGQYGFVTEDTISAYSAIAPTIATSFVGWRTSLRETAGAVGEDARAAALIAELEAEIAATADRLAGTALQMRWLFGYPDYFGQLNDRSPIGALLTEMGLPTLPAQVVSGEAADQIFPEQLGDILAGADAVIVLDFDDPPGDGGDVLAQQALYANSEVVRGGRFVDLGVEDSNAAYFDSVLTVRRNLALIERVITQLS
jgi:iron complex transport system substrate-binding protein